MSLIPKVSAPSVKIPSIPAVKVPSLPKLTAPKLPSISKLPKISLPKVKLPSVSLPALPSGLSGITSGLKKPNFSSVQSKLTSLVKKVG